VLPLENSVISSHRRLVPAWLQGIVMEPTKKGFHLQALKCGCLCAGYCQPLGQENTTNSQSLQIGKICDYGGAMWVFVTSIWLGDEAFNQIKSKHRVPAHHPLLVIAPSNEIYRQFLLQARDPHKNKWSTLFRIKKSTINGVGYGLFAARPYSVHDILGLYLGDVYNPKKKETPTSQYRPWKLNGRVSNYLLMQELGHVAHLLSVPILTCFGIHLVNDPIWW
jgi:hypothetical protein